MPEAPRPSAASTSAAPARAGSSRSVRTWLVVVAVLVVAAAAAWWALRSTEEGGSSAAADLEHVHGLGVDPADGSLHVGSHYGLFEVSEEDETIEGPLGDRVQDFMGFTVAGPDHFLASGHPGAGQDGPGSLGLIESTDGGQSWTSRSLEGEADFHALEYRHGTVYGANAMTGAFMVSDDMESWDTRSTVAIADFAVSPSDPDTLVATTGEGPALSADGGRTFELVEGAPLLLLVSWADDGTLVALDPTGSVYTSTDDAATFERVGMLGAEPEALHAGEDGSVYASASGRLWRSEDGGRTFARFPTG